MKDAHNRLFSASVARRRRSAVKAGAWLLLAAFLGLAIGFAAAVATASTYTGHAVVLVTPLEGNPFNPTGNGDDLNNLQSEAQLAQSDAVVSLVSAPRGVAATGLTVTVPPNTQLLEFTYQARDRDAARAGADGFATAYLQFRTSRADQAVVARAREIQDEINSQSDRINDLAKQKRGVSSAEQRAVIQQQMNGITAQIVQLSTTLSAVTTIDRDPGQIVTAGHIIGRSPQTSIILYSVVGLIVGFGTGVLFLVLGGRRHRDGKTSHADEFSDFIVAEPAGAQTHKPNGVPVGGKERAARGNPQ